MTSLKIFEKFRNCSRWKYGVSFRFLNGIFMVNSMSIRNHVAIGYSLVYAMGELKRSHGQYTKLKDALFCMVSDHQMRCNQPKSF